MVLAGSALNLLGGLFSAHDVNTTSSLCLATIAWGGRLEARPLCVGVAHALTASMLLCSQGSGSTVDCTHALHARKENVRPHSFCQECSTASVALNEGKLTISVPQVALTV